MGKRKERRLAAHGNASRRVKLDLFAEPSGDLGGSSIVKEELGEDIDLTQPKSPSSSVQEPQNPLLLLGQYSDDEFEEEPSKTISQAPSLVISLPSHVDQDKSEGDWKDDESNAIDDPEDQTAESQDPESDSLVADTHGVDGRAGDVACFTDASKQMDPSGNDVFTGDVIMGWKMVLHEESNQYYYWNTETGETSWEVPAIPTETTTNQKAPDGGGVAQEVCEPCAGVGHLSSVAVVDGSTGGSEAFQSTHDSAQQVDDSIEGQKSGVLEPKGCVDNAERKDCSNSLTAVLGDGLDSTNYLGIADDHKRGMELPLTLVTHCESLLDRLASLRGSDGCSQAHDWTSTYILEVRVRLADIRSLSLHGTTLQPFWLHTEKQLSQLEDMVNKKIYELAVSAQMEDNDGDDAELKTDCDIKENERMVASSQHESETCGHDNSGVSAGSCPSSNDESNMHYAAKGVAVLEDNQVISLDSLSTLDGGVVVPSLQVNGTCDTTRELQAGDDIDMDVDMEVEETIPVPIVMPEDGTKFVATAGQLIQTSSPPPGDLSFIPPPPDDEWIPPPPPDNYEHPPLPPDCEQVQTPPPNESNEPSYQSLPSHLEIAQSLQYAHAYNICYADPAYQCYENAVAVPSSSMYMHSDPSQVGGPDPSLYYGTVPHTYPEAASVLIPAGAVAYYDIQNGSVATVPAADMGQSSVLQMDVAPTSYGIIAPTLSGQVNDSAEAGTSLNVDELTRDTEGDLTSEEATASAYVQNLANVTEEKEIGEDDAHVTSVVPAQVAAGKAQSKVLRSKKRTVAVPPSLSLRSNKKVSSLVDKWKAAKEELNEDEEEPEDAYEKLEKKRQREIEAWKAKQIASGEAKDNANFQPLGGDWRERVKRKRAQAASKDSSKKQMETPIDKSQQADVAELSNGLPTGWQVYWDEASKSVYYGNTKTLETTWTRPTK